MMDVDKSRRAPAWFAAVCVILALPAFQTPALLSAAPDIDIVKTLVWIYPLYVIVCAYLAWACWATRRAVAWMLLGLLVLTHVAMWALVNTAII